MFILNKEEAVKNCLSRVTEQGVLLLLNEYSYAEKINKTETFDAIYNRACEWLRARIINGDINYESKSFFLVKNPRPFYFLLWVDIVIDFKKQHYSQRLDKENYEEMLIIQVALWGALASQHKGALRESCYNHSKEISSELYCYRKNL